MARSDRATRSAGSSWVSPWRTTRFWYCIVNNWTYPGPVLEKHLYKTTGHHMTNFLRAYMRASTDEQDSQRARGMLDRFAGERGLVICNYYAENESGAHLNRPELFRLLADSRPHDVLLIEDVDRLSRLTATEWDRLKLLIRERQVRVVAVNVPTTWQHLAPARGDFDTRMFGAINDMLIDMLAAIARRDYEQRRERQAQGIAKAKISGKYRGRQADSERYDAINRLLVSKSSWSEVQRIMGCSRSTISAAIQHAKKQILLQGKTEDFSG